MVKLSGRNGLRDIVENLAAQMHLLYHLGSGKISHSILSRINENKSDGLYEALFGKLLRHCQGMTPSHNFRFKNPLYSLDTSIIDLCLSVFSWAKLRMTNGAIKLHVCLNHDGNLPEFFTVTDGTAHDVTIGCTLQFPNDSIASVDRGYNDYGRYNQSTENKILFLTRLRSNAIIRTEKRYSVEADKGLTISWFCCES